MMFNDNNPIELINTNQHLDLFKKLKDLLMCNYLVRAKYTHNGYNGEALQCNNKVLAFRNKKRGPIHFRKGVTVIEHNLSKKQGGSNNYPAIGYEGAFIELEFVSDGLPNVNKTNGWSIKIISIEKTVLESPKVKWENIGTAE